MDDMRKEGQRGAGEGTEGIKGSEGKGGWGEWAGGARPEGGQRAGAGGRAEQRAGAAERCCSGDGGGMVRYGGGIVVYSVTVWQ